MTRPTLRAVDHNHEMARLLNGEPDIFCTMSPGQWDDILECAYDTDCTLLEIDHDERCVAAYRRVGGVEVSA